MRQNVHFDKINHSQSYVHYVIENKRAKQYNYDYNCSLKDEVLNSCLMIHSNTVRSGIGAPHAILKIYEVYPYTIYYSTTVIAQIKGMLQSLFYDISC